MATETKQIDIEKMVRNVIAERLDIKDLNEIKNNSTLSSLGADSLDRLDLIIYFEDEFNVNFDDFNEDNNTNVEQIINYIKIKYHGKDI